MGVVLESSFTGAWWRLSGGLMQKSGTQPVVVGIDVGGTKIQGVGMDARLGGVPAILFSHQVATQRAHPSDFFDRLAVFIRDFLKDGADRGFSVDPHIGVGMPGRYVSDSKGKQTIASGTAPNLGTTSNDFDGVNPARELSHRVPGCIFTVHNDAVAQMRYGLEILLRLGHGVPDLRGQRVCYLGPGTGLGGGFAQVDADGGVAVRTDGHVFDMVVFPTDVPLALEVRGQRLEIRRPGTAEELLSGKAVATLMADVDAALVGQGKHPLFSPLGPGGGWLLDQCLAGNAGTETERDVALQIAQFEGRMLGRVMDKIHRGEIVKTAPAAAWSDEDKAFARGITYFVIGGSVLRGAVGDHVRRSALNELAVLSSPTFYHLLSLPTESGHAGALGAALLAGKISVH